MKHRRLFQQDLRCLVQSFVCRPKECILGYKKAVLVLNQMRIPRLAQHDSWGVSQNHLSSLSQPSSFNPLEDVFRRFRLIIVIGESGDLVALKALAGLLQSWVWVDGGRPRLCFLDSLDSEIFWELMSVAHPHTTGIIVLSRTGESEQILLPLMRCLEYWQGLMEPDLLRQRFIMVTADRPTRLMSIVRRWGLTWWTYPDATDDPLVCFHRRLVEPLVLTGFDLASFYQGIRHTSALFSQGQLPASLETTGALWAACSLNRLRMVQWKGTGEIFNDLMIWMQHFFQQNISCHRLAVAPMQSEPVEHTMMTLFHEEHVARERLVPDFWNDFPLLKTLAQTTMMHWSKGDFDRRCQAYAAQKHGVRIIHVRSMNEETMGALVAHHCLETLLLRALLENSV